MVMNFKYIYRYKNKIIFYNVSLQESAAFSYLSDSSDTFPGRRTVPVACQVLGVAKENQRSPQYSAITCSFGLYLLVILRPRKEMFSQSVLNRSSAAFHFCRTQIGFFLLFALRYSATKIKEESVTEIKGSFGLKLPTASMASVNASPVPSSRLGSATCHDKNLPRQGKLTLP